MKPNDAIIFLGYDIVSQASLAVYLDTTIICDNSERSHEILNGLCDVAVNLPRNQPVPLGEDGGVEVVLMVQTPWMKTVQYSDQAWNDLLSVAAEVREG